MHPELWDIFGNGRVVIRYYGVMYAVAFLVGMFLAKKEGKRRGIEEKLIEDYAFITMISGLIGARLYYVILNWAYYSKFPSEIIAVWHGGMAIHGGIIGGIIGTIIFAKKKKIDKWILGDIAAAPLILGQAFGRFGNFMNGDAHGVPMITPLNVMFSNTFKTWWTAYNSMVVELQQQYKELFPWGLVFRDDTPAGREFRGMKIHPVMLYELILNFIAFLMLWFIFRKKNMPKGYIFLIYIIQYAVIRTVVTIFRADDLMLFGLRAPHVVSILMIIGAVYFMVLLRKKDNPIEKKKKKNN